MRSTAATPSRVKGDDALTSDELLMFLCILVVAGNETTRNAITGGLKAFSDFPDQKQKLIDNPELVDLAVDEIVRYVSPVISFCRTVTRDHEFHGKQLKADDKVLILYQSANRDERVFDDPDEFRIDRDPNPHLGLRHRPALLPGRQPGQARGEGGVRGAVLAPPRHPRQGRRTCDPWRQRARARHRAPARGVHPGRARGTDYASSAMSVTEPLDQRQRILDAALHLMAERGVHAMSMRTLATACGLNVATLYHYFPSKAELLAEVVHQQDYAALLAPMPPIDADLPPRARLSALLRWIWDADGRTRTTCGGCCSARAFAATPRSWARRPS